MRPLEDIERDCNAAKQMLTDKGAGPKWLRTIAVNAVLLIPALIARVRELEAAGWISVDDKPIPKKGSVLAYNANQPGSMYVAWRSVHGHILYTGGEVTFGTTHWMPLPDKPPTQQEGSDVR